MTEDERIANDLERWNENPWWNIWEDTPRNEPHYCAMCHRERPIDFMGLFGIRYGGPFYRSFCFDCGHKIQELMIKMDCDND